MYTGGTGYSPQVARIISFAALIVPFILTGYGYLHAVNIIDSKNFISFEMLTLISVSWMIIAVWQFLVPSKTRMTVALRLSLYHVLAAFYLLFVTGIVTPFAACWILLLITASVYFNRLAVLLSVAVFLITVLADIFTWGNVSVSTVLYDLAVLVAVLICAVVVMSMGRAQAIDRSELRRSHEQEVLQRDRILTIVNNLTDAVLSTDKRGIIRVYNAASLDLLDTNDSLNGHHIDIVLPLVNAENKPVEVTTLAKSVTSSQIFDDVWYVFDDGERTRLEMTISPIRKTFRRTSNTEDGHIIILRDITKSKSLEEERDEFISVVSHELRTPITVVEGSLSNLEVMIDKDKVSKKVLRDAVDLAHDQILYLSKMVNDLSTLSRAERGTADVKEHIDVQSLLKSLYDTYAPHAHEKGLAFDLDAGAQLGQVEVSRLYLEELLQNFITNSIKYTKKGSVKLTASRSGDTITFAVKDTGIGISKSEQAKVFEKFYRSEDYRTRETGGTGLGLYVVTKLARKVGTEINLKSRLNHGSTFSFTLPVYKEK
ncbi:MAG TPA: ATP-binding protein [Candidatus Saccharibacteria bacterium]|nr:ATP-binding protein [Candidatus Saccharibacteria bacterium]